MQEAFEIEFAHGVGLLSPTVRSILDHVCDGPAECRSIAIVAEWCDATDDDSYVVICPGCGARFIVDEGDLAELRRWTDAVGNTLACGVRWE